MICKQCGNPVTITVEPIQADDQAYMASIHRKWLCPDCGSVYAYENLSEAYAAARAWIEKMEECLSYMEDNFNLIADLTKDHNARYMIREVLDKKHQMCGGAE
jgi:uncharacterized Zn finger protein